MRPSSEHSVPNPSGTPSLNGALPDGVLSGTSTQPAPNETDKTISFRQDKAAKNPLTFSDAPDSATISHTAPALLASSTRRPHAVEAINTEPAMIAEGVFVGEGRAKTGEKVFLKMERVTASNIASWQDYCQSTIHVTQRDRSLLSAAMITTKKIDENGAARFINNHYEQMAEGLGQTKEEFNDFINSLGRLNLFKGEANAAKINAVHNIAAGARHLLLDTHSECYVVYASKTADFRLPRFRENHAPFNMPTYKDYSKHYGDLLICVGVDFPQQAHSSAPAFVHSKGMFRNPVSFLEKTHKGLSMVIRGFAGAVTQKFFPGIETLQCTPLASMQYQISTSLTSDDYKVSGYSHAEALSKATEMLQDGDVYEIATNTIKISALDRLYRDHAKT